MAAYYLRRPPTSTSRGLSSRDARENVNEGRTIAEDISATERSIYIFPNPPSVPHSPTPPSPGSSVFSVPTDLESSNSYSFPSRSSNAPSTAATVSERGLARPHVPPLPDNELEIDVDLWELSTDPELAADVSDSDSSWVLEEAVDRIGARGFDLSPSRQPRRMHRLSSPTSPDSIPALQYWAVRHHRRSRTHSRNRTVSSLSSRAPSMRRPSPNPRIHIPLLSFISSLLSVDLDDPALRLLTHTDPVEVESVLFPGHTTQQLLGQDGTSHTQESGSEGETDADSVSTEDEELHGLPKLLLASLSDHSAVAIRSLRDGLAIYVPHAPDIGLPIPHPSEIFGLWRAVGQACIRGTQAWKEVWRGDRLPSQSRGAEAAGQVP